MRVKVIGIGGIGGCLLPVLCKFLSYHEEKNVDMVLVDGDTYERKNAERQFFKKVGNKAEVTAERLRDDFPRVGFEFLFMYADEANIESIIREGDIVFLCVDNHATRKLVSDCCEELSDVVLISGGNGFTDGNIQVFVRKDGEDVTLPLTNDRHPEIAEPKDKHPNELSCEELMVSEPQLIIMNNAIAAAMLNCFYAYLQGKLNYTELYVDIITGNSRPVVMEVV